MPAAIAASAAAAGNVLETATSVTESRDRPARLHAVVMRSSPARTFTRISSALSIGASPPLPPPLTAVHGKVGETIGVLVSRAQRVADRESSEEARKAASLLMQRNEVRMFDAILPEHLLYQQLRVRHDLDVGRARVA